MKMKLLVLAALAFGGSVFAQCSSFPNATLTTKIYWAHQPPAVQALHTMAPDKVESKAAELATKGYVIDVPIMVWGYNPVCMMGMRLDYGYTWVPSALQPNICSAPGLSTPACASPYDPKNPPEKSILVSIDAKDYPPFTAPKPPVAKPVANVVGKCLATNVCGLGPGASTEKLRAALGLVDGTVVKQDGVSYTFHSVKNPFGESTYFTK